MVYGVNDKESYCCYTSLKKEWKSINAKHKEVRF